MKGAANGTLGDPAERERRRALLALPHAAPLAAYAAGLRRPGAQVPDFDPLDGGTAARVLFVLEKPGPGIHPGGFVSRDNDTPTAAAVRAFMAQAGLPRRETALWNLVPWWGGRRRRRGCCWAACACWPARTLARRCGLGSGSGGMQSRRCGGKRCGLRLQDRYRLRPAIPHRAGTSVSPASFRGAELGTVGACGFRAG